MNNLKKLYNQTRAGIKAAITGKDVIVCSNCKSELGEYGCSCWRPTEPIPLHTRLYPCISSYDVIRNIITITNHSFKIDANTGVGVCSKCGFKLIDTIENWEKSNKQFKP